MAGMVIPIGLGFGRMGCLLAGCCFGTRTDGAMALHFPGFSPASEAQFKAGLLRAPNLESLGVQPSQVYESAASLALGAVLMLYLHGRKRYDGQVFVWFVVGYAALRFVIEAFRADDRGIFFGLSTSQWIGIALIGAAVYAHKKLVARSEALAKLPLGPATA
jgi:phosphatidylglycerol:prolipoprotein diacylglycerol transferase